MNFDPNSYRYNSKRNIVYSKNGMVATSHPLAAQAGLDTLKRGGNAVDAAIATASTLTVVEPTSNGIGGDCFAIVWHNNELHGLNSSGHSPSNISIEKLKEDGKEDIPKFGWEPVTVPGVPGGWAKLWKNFGKIDYSEVFQPAIDIAENGHPISVTAAYYWQRALKTYKKLAEERPEIFKYWMNTFSYNGKAPKAGEIWKFTDHADTLKRIANSLSRGFYEGEIAKKIDKFSRKTGGYIRYEDLKEYEAKIVDPVNINYKGYDVWEIPPNGQGITALMALNILKDIHLKGRSKDEIKHIQIEAMKLAFADTKAHVTDPDFMKLKVSDLLSKEYADKRKSLIKEKAKKYDTGFPHEGGTVYLSTADKDGNMVSFIQSNYMGFGSGVVVPKTGIALQNRGKNFSFDKNHPNSLEPNKRPYHTIIPGFITKDEKAVGPFGVMGGFMQPQGHLQVLTNMIDDDMNPQEALDCPRWMFSKDKTVFVEKDFDTNLAKKLQRRGHNIKVPLSSGMFGRGQIILKNENGSYVGGTEKRTDGTIAAY